MEYVFYLPNRSGSSVVEKEATLIFTTASYATTSSLNQKTQFTIKAATPNKINRDRLYTGFSIERVYG